MPSVLPTPNHWHTLACDLGDEGRQGCLRGKTGTHNLYEGKKLIEAAKKYKRVIQHGMFKLRSSVAMQEQSTSPKRPDWQCYMARGLVFKWRPDIGNKATEPVPEGLTMTSGRAPRR